MPAASKKKLSDMFTLCRDHTTQIQPEVDTSLLLQANFQRQTRKLEITNGPFSVT